MFVQRRLLNVLIVPTVRRVGIRDFAGAGLDEELPNVPLHLMNRYGQPPGILGDQVSLTCGIMLLSALLSEQISCGVAIDVRLRDQASSYGGIPLLGLLLLFQMRWIP